MCGVLVGFAIGFFVALWWDNPGRELPPLINNDEVIESSPTDSDANATSSLELSEQSPEPTPASFSVTEEQRAMLQRFGINPDTITITQEMVLCAEQALGKERISDIMAGATPSVFESMKLLGCYQ